MAEAIITRAANMSGVVRSVERLRTNIFTSNQFWTVPDGYNKEKGIRVLIVGAGGGAQIGWMCADGGGGGDINNGIFYPNARESIEINIGVGSGAAGGTSKFGSYISAAGASGRNGSSGGGGAGWIGDPGGNGSKFGGGGGGGGYRVRSDRVLFGGGKSGGSGGEYGGGGGGGAPYQTSGNGSEVGEGGRGGTYGGAGGRACNSTVASQDGTIGTNIFNNLHTLEDGSTLDYPGLAGSKGSTVYGYWSGGGGGGGYGGSGGKGASNWYTISSSDGEYGGPGGGGGGGYGANGGNASTRGAGGGGGGYGGKGADGVDYVGGGGGGYGKSNYGAGGGGTAINGSSGMHGVCIIQYYEKTIEY